MRRNGYTSAGKIRYRCSNCNTSTTERRDSKARKLARFLNWLSGNKTAKQQSISTRSFYRLTAQCWQYWPISECVTTPHPVVFIDGIHLGRQAVVLIARNYEHTLAWHVARAESTRGWIDLLRRIPAPQVIVSDGGTGIERAVHTLWPKTVIQRCTFHISAAIRRYTTQRPRLPAGIELLALANRLTKITSANEARQWIVDYNTWCMNWHTFLKQRTVLANGKTVFTHERLRAARRMINKVIKDGTLFRYCDPSLQVDVDFDWRTTNCAESFNAKLRRMLDLHRGMPLLHRIKAIGWMCYLDQEEPLPLAQLVNRLPTDEDIDQYYRDAARIREQASNSPYGAGIVWEEFHW